MLAKLIILSLCVATINAGGEFSVLSSPKSLIFKGSDAVQSQYVGDVLNAALGNAVQGDTNWSGLSINNPFSVAKGVVAVLVEGTEHITVSSNAKTYNLQGSSSDESLSALSSSLEASNVPVCDIDFNQFEKAVVTFRACFGDIQVADVKDTKALKNDKEFLQSIAYVQAAADNLAKMVKQSNVLVMRVSLESVSKPHGKKSDAMEEAVKLVSNVVANLNEAAQKTSNNEALVVAISSEAQGIRRKREAVPNKDDKDKLSTATYYNSNYPVIFNIILWFMVVFGLSLLAICYAIGSMDPGRDSIIYRMTSTRMKKDN